jgi:asparagine N-glycosylation enzyme membrane subunit Stt3
MAGKKLDRQKAGTALETIKESPVIAAVAAAPAVIGLALIWWLAGFGWAVLAAIALVAFVGYKITR